MIDLAALLPHIEHLPDRLDTPRGTRNGRVSGQFAGGPAARR